MQKRLMILGSLDEFVRLVQMAGERGIYTIVCDGYKDSPAKQIADKAYDIDVTHTEEIAQVCRQEKVDGIITSFSDLLFECMVKIASLAGLKCYLTPDKLLYYRDKTAMKTMFHEIGVPTSKFVTLSADFADDELKDFHFPVVVKPVDRYGSRGIFVLDSMEKIRERFAEVSGFSDIPKILVEEYNDGYEFNMMTWVLDGTVRVISIADREKTPIGTEDIPISTRNVYPSRLYRQVHDEALEILQKVADYTGQKDGALSMQFFWSPGNGISVCEVAGRFLGYEHELVELGSGFCMEDLLLNYVYDEAALRASLMAHDSRMKRCCAVLYFHGQERIVADQTKAREIAGREDVVFDQIFYRDGERVVQHGPNPYVARYYVTGDSRAAVDRSTEEIFRRISIKDPEGREILYPNKMTVYPEAQEDV
ncbi:MAG: ATP-grasp domain-containing protein [Candidatus Choladocola sp.]|nr:ATP-grasp domain-containing protein [Candidatus Choladocola sp.]